MLGFSFKNKKQDLAQRSKIRPSRKAALPLPARISAVNQVYVV